MERRKVKALMSGRTFFTCFLAAILAVLLGACSKKELASQTATSDVFVEVEPNINPEIGATAALTDNVRRKRKVRLSQREADELAKLGNSPRVAAVPRATLGYCPSIQVLAGTGILTAYTSSDGIETPEDVDHQATITRSGRECKVENGKLIVRVGAAGRAIKGPKSATPTVSLPIRVAVVRNQNEVLFSELYAHPITFQSANAQGFSFIKDDVEIPFPERQNLKIFVGFDTKDGPLAAKFSQKGSTTQAQVKASQNEG